MIIKFYRIVFGWKNRPLFIPAIITPTFVYNGNAMSRTWQTRPASVRCKSPKEAEPLSFHLMLLS